MTHISVRVVIDAPASAVWDHLADIGRHPEWMVDAIAIRFTGDQRRGVGTSFDCLTRVGPFRTHDRMVVTEWREGRSLGVRHTGVVTGEGRFRLEHVRQPGRPDRAAVVWEERLRFPWYLGGPLAAALVSRLVLRRLWRANLRRLASRVRAEG